MAQKAVRCDQGTHPAIIDPDEFDAVQIEIERRRFLGRPNSCTSIFAAKIVCNDCGGWYGKKIWSSYKGDKTRRREIWQCNDKYAHCGKPGKGCGTPNLTEEEVKERFLKAFNTLMTDRDGLIEDCRLAQRVLYDSATIDAEIAELRQEIDVMEELSRRSIAESAHPNPGENAKSTDSKNEWSEHFDNYLERRRMATERVNELEAVKREQFLKSRIIESFIHDIEIRPLVLTEFDEKLWLAVVDRVIVGKGGRMVFRFRGGVEVVGELFLGFI